MDSSDLEFFTARELIDELMRRKTFLGIVVHSKEELKNDNWGEERVFQVHYNSNLKPSEARRLLGAVRKQIGKRPS